MESVCRTANGGGTFGNVVFIRGLGRGRQGSGCVSTIQFGFTLRKRISSSVGSITCGVALRSKISTVDRRSRYIMRIGSKGFSCRTRLSGPAGTAVHTVFTSNSLYRTCVRRIFIPNGGLGVLIVSGGFITDGAPFARDGSRDRDIPFSREDIRTPGSRRRPREIIARNGRGRGGLFNQNAHIPNANVRCAPTRVKRRVKATLAVTHPARVERFSFSMLSYGVGSTIVNVGVCHTSASAGFVNPVLTGIRRKGGRTVNLHPIRFFILRPKRCVMSVNLISYSRRAGTL